MSEEILQQPSLEPGFKTVCKRMGLMLIAIFGFRLLAEIVAIPVALLIKNLSPLPMMIVNSLYSIVFLYILPMISAILIFKKPVKHYTKSCYNKPKYTAKAMAMFPAGYGFGIAVNLITQLVAMLFEGTAISDSFKSVQNSMEGIGSIPEALVQFVMLAVIAPLFEEFWFRGIIMENMRQYGNGFAIFVSAIMFGFTHANFQQVFYATALGIFLGYIALSTGSIVLTTIMHALFNSISGIMLLLGTVPSVQDYLLEKDNAEVTPAVILYYIFMGFVALLLVVGIIMLIAKLAKIKKYKVPKVQTEISTAKRWKILLTRPTMIVSYILIVIVYMEPVIISWISKAIS